MKRYTSMRKKILHVTGFALSTLALISLSSCDSAKRTNYLRDIEVAKVYGVKYDAGIVIQKGDKLGIIVTSLRNPELTLPFNAKGSTVATTTTAVTSSVSLPDGVNAPVSPDAQHSYLVDAEGNIQFPVLGTLQVKGLTLEQVSELIRTRLVSGKYLMDAHVVTKFDNLRVYLLGAFEALGSSGSVGKITDRGSFHLDDPKTNILELLSKSGGLSEQADFERVNVIRRVGSEYVYYRLDMLSKNIFESPAFYLQQNDIVYAEYKYRKKDTESKILSTVAYLTTAMSTVVTAIALVGLFNKK